MSQQDIARGYMQGNCDVMALALSRLTGKPMGLWGGRFDDDQSETGDGYEFAHACVILDEDRWIDVNGISSDAPEYIRFNNPVHALALFPAEEDEIRSTFTCETISEESVRAAMDFALSYPPVADCLSDLVLTPSCAPGI